MVLSFMASACMFKAPERVIEPFVQSITTFAGVLSDPSVVHIIFLI